jgi:hypothetical protein
VLLSRIKAFFASGPSPVGNISFDKDCAVFAVKSIKDLFDNILPHFDNYPLLTQKRADYLLFKQVVEAMINKQHLTVEGLTKIVGIRASMNKGLTEILTTNFPNITPVVRPLVDLRPIVEPNWLAGFIDAEGHFYVVIRKSPNHRLGFQVGLRFKITQHSRDQELLNSFIQYLGCGQITKDSRSPVVEFLVTRLSDIDSKIVPFLDKCPLQGVKLADYLSFREVVQIMDNNGHLTSEGLEVIRKIKSEMNTLRDYNQS